MVLVRTIGITSLVSILSLNINIFAIIIIQLNKYNKDMNRYDYGWPEALFGCLAAIIFFLLSVGIGGLMTMLLWNWLAPIFWHSAPILSFLESCGVVMLISGISSMFKSRSK